MEACGHSSQIEWFMVSPEWLKDPDRWPGKIITQPTRETKEEAKLTKEVLAAAVDTKDDLYQVLEKNTFWKTVRVTAWIRRFLKNCKLKKSARLVSPFTTSETGQQVQWWLKRA